MITGCIAYCFQFCVYFLPRVWFWILFMFYGRNIALLIGDDHIQNYHIDTIRSNHLGCSHFASPHCLVVRACKLTSHSFNTNWANSLQTYKNLSWVVRNTSAGVVYRSIIAMVSIFKRYDYCISNSLISNLHLTSCSLWIKAAVQ